jgi:hypothetical protein
LHHAVYGYWARPFCRRQAWPRHRPIPSSTVHKCNTLPGITADTNFDDAPHAILLLFRIATGER